MWPSKMIEARAQRGQDRSEAAATQSAVEKEEKAYDERQRARAETEEKAKEAGTAPKNPDAKSGRGAAPRLRVG
jgi:hypothetical protein